MTLKHRIAESLVSRGTATAFRFPVRGRLSGAPGISGDDVLAQASALAGRLWAVIGQGQSCDGGLNRNPAPVAVVVLPAGWDFVRTLLACMLADIAVVPVAIPRKGAATDRLLRQIGDCRADAILSTGQYCHDLQQILDRSGHGGNVGHVKLCDVNDLPETGGDDLASLLGRATGDGPAVIQFTSGSSRFPKAAAISAAAILANCDLIARYWGMDGDTVMVNWLPHYHDMGLMGGVLYPLLCGGQSIQMAPLDVIQRPRHWLQAISESGANFSGGPAFGFARCLDAIRPDDCAGLDLSGWRVAYCGAEPVHAGILHAFRQRFGPYGLRPNAVFACYGMAEYTLFAAGMPGHDAVGNQDTHDHIGANPDQMIEPCFIPEGQRSSICIVHPDTAMPMSDGETGEIWLRGASLASGYLLPVCGEISGPVIQGSGTQDELAADQFTTAADENAVFDGRLAAGGDGAANGLAKGEPAGWLRTGDLGFVRDGYLFVTGRIKDTLIVNGRKIAAPELEWLAAGFDSELNPMAAAAFMPDILASGQAVLLIEKRSNQSVIGDEAALCEKIRRAVAGEWGIVLHDIQIVRRGTLPRTTSGKIRRAQAALDYAQSKRDQNVLSPVGMA